MVDRPLRLDPTATALLVIDMQNDFCDPAGYYARAGRDVAPLRGAIGPTLRLVSRAREAGVSVAYTRLSHGGGAMQQRHRLTPRRWTGSGDRLQPGGWGIELVPQLAPAPDELVVDKAGYSGFDDTPLEQWLRGRGVTTVLLCGVVGYACVLATGFSAFDRSFDVVVASDAVGSWDRRLGDGALETVELLLGHATRSDAIEFAPEPQQGSPSRQGPPSSEPPGGGG
ncbi:MAG: cysteine hydrolase family protein [Micromonosporaceae bacterium]